MPRKPGPPPAPTGGPPWNSFIRSALGKAAVAEPVISLDTAFTAFAAAAGLPGNFSPYADDYSFLLGAYILTEVGTTAYNGAAPS